MIKEKGENMKVSELVNEVNQEQELLQLYCFYSPKAFKHYQYNGVLGHGASLSSNTL